MHTTRHHGMRPAAILARLFVVLTLVFSGLLPGHGDRSAASGDLSAQSRIDLSDGILMTQRPVVRVLLAGDDTPTIVPHPTHDPVRPDTAAARVSVVIGHELRSSPIRLLPPVRGPPAA